jgi:cation transport ATPase
VLAGIFVHLILRYLLAPAPISAAPLLVVLGVGGALLVPELIWQAAHARFGSDQLAGVSIVASALLGEYLAGAIVVLMLSGGESLQMRRRTAFSTCPDRTARRS